MDDILSSLGITDIPHGTERERKRRLWEGGEDDASSTAAHTESVGKGKSLERKHLLARLSLSLFSTGLSSATGL